jgi:hypothetical protein
MSPSSDTLPRVACIVTEYRPRSHADVIVSKLLGGHTQPEPRDPARFDFHLAARQFSENPLPLDEDGRLRQPRVRVASLYTDQVPETDISREWAERAGVPIFPTIQEALTMGGDRLAVDGVILIGEHGDYPENERGQQMYPRRRFFEETVAVFQASGRVVPVFNDKHLGYAWQDAKWMYDTARAMGFPMQAGSSLSVTPVAWRKPAFDLSLDAPLEGALALGYGPIERYGFHTLEVLQCMVERRSGGETGVAAVQCLTGPAMWDAASDGRWDHALLDAALDTLEERPAGDPRDLAKEPIVFLLDYRDGLRAAAVMLNGVVRDLAFAGRANLPGSRGSQIVATRFAHHGQEPFGHFAHLVEHIQDLICTGREPYPVERTLLTTGVLDRIMESRWREGARLETPELAISYRCETA